MTVAAGDAVLVAEVVVSLEVHLFDIAGIHALSKPVVGIGDRIRHLVRKREIAERLHCHGVKTGYRNPVIREGPPFQLSGTVGEAIERVEDLLQYPVTYEHVSRLRAVTNLN